MIAAVLGLDTAAGAYLARLLDARGVAVRGTGGAALLDRLGIAGDVTRAESATTAMLGADLVFDLRGDAAATSDVLKVVGRHRLFVAVDPDDAALIAGLAAARDAGRFVATGRIYPHESRLGPGSSPVARIVVAAAAGRDPDPADLATSTDCGWTPEYVDAMARMLTLPTAADLTIASGRSLDGRVVARVAAEYFGRPAPSADGTDPVAPATRSDVPGWRAITVGDDLVTVLCEGAAAS